MKPTLLLAHSIGMSLCNREASVVRLSVNFYTQVAIYFYHTHDSIATKLAHDGSHMGLHPGCAQGQGQGQRSRDTDTFLTTQKSLLLPQNKHDWIATKLAYDGPHIGLHPGCAEGQDRGQRSLDTGPSVMSRTDVLSLHALTLRSSVTSV